MIILFNWKWMQNKNHHIRRLPWSTGACFPCLGISEVGSAPVEFPTPLRLLLVICAIPFDPISAESVTSYNVISGGQLHLV